MHQASAEPTAIIEIAADLSSAIGGQASRERE